MYYTTKYDKPIPIDTRINSELFDAITLRNAIVRGTTVVLPAQNATYHRPYSCAVGRPYHSALQQHSVKAGVATKYHTIALRNSHISSPCSLVGYMFSLDNR